MRNSTKSSHRVAAQIFIFLVISVFIATTAAWLMPSKDQVRAASTTADPKCPDSTKRANQSMSTATTGKYNAKPRNVPECNIGTDANLHATPWFSAPGSTFHKTGGTFYYDPEVSEPKIDVEFRGSFYAAGDFTNVTLVESIRLGCNLISSAKCGSIPVGKGDDPRDYTTNARNGVFSSLQTANYDRGKGDGKKGFYNSGKSKTGKINLTKVKDFSKNETGTQRLKAPLYSQVKYRLNSKNHYGSGSWIEVPIIVKQLSIWRLTPSTSINKTTVYPGQSVKWTHTATNKPKTANRIVTMPSGVQATLRGSVLYRTGGEASGVKDSIKVSELGPGGSKPLSTSYDVVGSDLGKKVCRATSISKYAYNQSGTTSWRGGICANVKDFSLVPSTTLSSVNKDIKSGKIQAGKTIYWTHKVTNSGTAAQIKNATGQGGNQGGNNSAAVSWTVSGLGTSKVSTKDSSYTTKASDAGKSICRYTRVNNRTNLGTAYSSWSGKVCVTVVAVTETDWDLVPSTSVDKATLDAGQTATWTHKVTNKGDKALGKSAHAQGGRNGNIAVEWDISTLGIGKFNTETSTYEAKPSDAGTTVCRRTRVNNTYGKSTAYSPWSAEACTTIPYNFNLIPTLDPVGEGIVEGGVNSKIPVKGQIINDTKKGKTKTSEGPFDWELSRLDFTSSTTITNDKRKTGDTPSKACSWTQYSGKKSCSVINQGTIEESIPYGGSYKDGIKDEDDLDDYPVGYTVCYVLSIKPYSQNSGANWRHSDMVCVTYGKKPKVQIHGGDVIVGRTMPGSTATSNSDIVTTLTNRIDTAAVAADPESTATKTYGSWGEYALVANGSIKFMSSGAGLNEGSDSKAQSSWSSFTFANTFSTKPAGCTGDFGCYKHTTSGMPDVSAVFKGGGDSLDNNTDVNTLKGKGSGIYSTTATTTINLGGGTLNGGTGANIGQWLVLYAPNATINVNGNIRYNNALLSSTRGIPQMVIIAKNINIDKDVVSIDSWLVSKNNIVTCVDGDSGDAAQLSVAGAHKNTAYNLSSKVCTKQLRVNGPVLTNKLWLRRTAGAGTGDSAGDPAEVFNYRPDALLWLNNYLKSNNFRTTNIIELPPRY